MTLAELDKLIQETKKKYPADTNIKFVTHSGWQEIRSYKTCHINFVSSVEVGNIIMEVVQMENET